MSEGLKEDRAGPGGSQEAHYAVSWSPGKVPGVPEQRSSQDSRQLYQTPPVGADEGAREQGDECGCFADSARLSH